MSYTTYTVGVAFILKDNFDKKSDELEKIAGRKSDSSGGGFGERDMQWFCRDKDEANKVYEKLRKVKWVTSCEIWEDEWEDEEEGG